MIINLTDIRKYEINVLFDGVSKARQDYSVRISGKNSDKNVRLSLASEYSLNQIMTKLYPNMTYPLDIKHDKSGCPLFADKTLSDLKNKYDINPYFSLSHSGDYGCSVVSENPVGIDIEKMDFEKHDTLEKLAARFFTSEESDWVKDDILRFYEIWCAKEAFLKASGLAGKLPMSGFRAEIVLGAQSAQSSENGEIYIKYDYQFDDNQSNRYIGKILLDKLDEGYMMAVCVRQKADTVIDCKFLVE